MNFALFNQPSHPNHGKFCEVVKIADKDVTCNSIICFYDKPDPDFYSVNRVHLQSLGPKEIIALLNKSSKPKVRKPRASNSRSKTKAIHLSE